MGRAKLTEMEYTTIKQLLEKGYEGQKVAAIVGRGRGLVSKVNVSSSYKEFVERGKATRAKYKNKYKTAAKPKMQQQLPLQPKTGNTTIDLRQSIWIKWSALCDEITLYKNTPTGKTTDESRDVNMALIKLEEAEMWLKRHW